MKNRSTFSRIISAILMIAIILSVGIFVYAETQTQEGVIAEWVTSKDSYTADDEIKLTLVVTNNYSIEKSFTYSVELPEGIEFHSGEPTSGEFPVGIQLEHRLTWIRNAPVVEEDTPQGDNTNNNQGDAGGSADVVTDAEEPADGVNVLNIILWLLLALAIIAGVVFVFIKRRGVTAMIAIILCAGLMVPMMAPLEVNATDEAKTIAAIKTITIDGKEVVLKANLSYVDYKPKYTVAEDGVRVYEAEQGRVMFEAEDQVMPGQDRIVIKEYDYASGGKAVRMTKPAEDNDEDGQPDYADYSETLPAQMNFRFVADQKGTYAVWARTYANSTAVSMIVSTNGEEYKYTRVVETVPAQGEFDWTRIVVVDCEEGDEVDIRIRSRHVGAEVDKFIITDNKSYVPRGEGTLPGPLLWDKVTEFDTEAFPDPKLYPAQGQHPRVMFTAADIPGILERLDHEDNKAARIEFDKKRGTEFDGILAENPGGSNYNANYLAVIEAKAFDYAINKDSDNQFKARTALMHGEEAVTAMINFLQTVTFSGTSMDYRYIGSTLFTAAEVYDWCYDLLDEDEMALIVAGAQIQASMIEAGFPPTTTLALSFTGHDGEYQIQQCWLAFAIAVADEYPSIYEFIGGMYFDLFLDARNVWFPSMAYHQGSAYGAYRFDADLWGQWLIYQMTGGDNDLNNDGKPDGYRVFTEEAAKVIYQWIYTRRPDGKIMTEGDDYEMTQTADNTWFDTLKTVIFSVANFYDDPVIYQELLRENPSLKPGSATTIYSPVMILILNDPEAMEKNSNTEVANLPLSRYLPTPYGGMIARTGWEWGLTSSDVLVTMQMTQRYVGGHQHRDTGSFQIYYKGLLSGDSGYYVNMGVDHDANYYKLSVAHNTLSITSKENPTGVQNNKSSVSSMLEGSNVESLRSKILGQEFGPNIYTPDYTYIAGDVAGAYDANVQEAIRSMLFLNLELDGNTKYPGAFVVFDQIKTTEPGSKKSFLLHATTRPTIEGNTITITNTEEGYSGKMVNQILYVGTANGADPAYKINRIGGEDKEFWYDGKNHPNQSTLADNMAYEPCWGRVEISTQTGMANQTDYMLNVMYVSDADGSTEVIPATLVKGNGVMGAQVFNHVAMFNMDGNNRISSTVSFTIPASAGYSTFKVNVAGMKAGTWTVTANGTSKDYIASEDGGMLYFDAPAGKVTITRKNDNSNKTFDTVDHREPVKDPMLLNVNSNYLLTDVKPVKSGDTVLIPTIAVFEALQSVIQREGSTVTIEYMGLQKIVIDTAKKTATVNGKSVDVSGMQISGAELLIPIETLELLITEDYGKAEWNERAKCAYITAKAPVYIPEEKRDFDNAIQVKNVYLTDEKNTGVDTSDSSDLMNTLDNSTSSYAALAGYLGEAGAVYDFGRVYTMDSLKIIFGQCKTRIYTFEILVSMDGVNFTALSGGKRFKSEKTKENYVWQEYKLPEDIQARYIKLVGYGNEPDNNWFNWQEIVFIGVPIQPGEVIHSKSTAVYSAPGGEQISTLTKGARMDVIKVQVVNGVAWAKIAWNDGYAWVRMADVALFEDTEAKIRDTGKVVANTTVWNMVWSDASALGQIPGGTAIEIIKMQVVNSVTYVQVRYNGYQGWVRMADIALTADPDEFSTAVGKVTATGGAKVYNRSSTGSIQMGNLPAGMEIEIFETKDIYGVIYGRIVYEGLDAWVDLADVEVYNPNPPFHMEIEAEKVTLHQGPDSTMHANGQILKSDVVTVTEDANASGGYVAKLTWNGRFANGTVTGGTDLTLNPAHLSFTVEADRTATYYVWVRYYAKANTSTISSYVDGNVYRGTSTTKATGWQYDVMGDDDYNSTVSGGYVWYRLAVCEWQTGQSYTVRLRGRDGGISYDKFVVTTDPGFSPSADDSMVTVEADKVIEAENVTNNPLFSDVIVDDTLESGKFVQLERVYSNDSLFTQNTGIAPAMGFKVTANKAGTYYVWGRFLEFGTMYTSISGYGSDYTYKYYKPDQKMEAKIEGWYLIGTYDVNEEGESIYIRLFGRSGTNTNKIDRFYITMDSEFVGVKPHEHTYSTNWSTDEFYHWRAATCGHADLITGKEEHVYDNDEDTSCNTCGYIRKLHPHTFSEAWTTDARYHWHAATCGCPTRVSDKAEHTFDENNLCTVCSTKKVFIVDESLTYIEAEKVTLHQGTDSSMIAGEQVLTRDIVTLLEDANASGGYVAKLNWSGRFANGTVVNGTDLTVNPAHLSFAVEASKTATYFVWVRYHTTANKPTINTYIDGNIFSNSSATTKTGWLYDEMGDDDYNSTVSGGYVWYRVAICEWEAGQTYYVRLRGRDGGISYDQFVVTADASFAPNGSEDLKSAEMDKVIEAEDVTFNPLFTDLVTDASKEDVKYVQTEKNHKYDDLYITTEGNSAAPAIGFKVTASAPGTYYVWGKFGTFDTLYTAISTHGSAYAYKYYKPDQKMEAKIAGWYLIGTYEVTEAGECIEVRLFGRSGSTKGGTANQIDQFYVTADSAFVGVQPHEHTYSTDWSKDASYHWHAANCGHTDLVTDKEAHVYDDDMDTTCDTCGHIREVHPHTFSDEWTSDDTYHWHAATCGCVTKVSDKAEHTFGADKLCTVCGAWMVYAAGSGQTYIEAEDVELFLERDVTTGRSGKTVQVGEIDGASGGKVAQWVWTGNYNYASKTLEGSPNLTAYPSHISFDVKASADGPYYIWVKLSYTVNNPNYFAYVDDNSGTPTGWVAKYLTAARESEQDFVWVKIAAPTWTAGETYTVRLRARNGGRINFDQFLVTSDSEFTPT